MAIKIVSRKWNPCVQDYVYEFWCDTDEDFNDLPESACGSLAMSIKTGAMCAVNASGEWGAFMDGKLANGGSSGSGGADWNASEGEAGYVKNRTHWVESEFITNIEEQTVNTEADRYNASGEVQLSHPFVVGNTYVVSFNGQPFECVAFGNDSDIAIGGDGFPFEIIYNGEWCGLFTPDAGAYTLKVTCKAETVHKLDKKFLPDDIGGGEKYIRIRWYSHDDKYSCNMSYEEACDLCFNESGLPAMGVYSSDGINNYLESCGDYRGSYDGACIGLRFFRLGSSDNYVELYYLPDGTITDIMPGGK